MKRDIESRLIAWKDCTKRKPLIIIVARQEKNTKKPMIQLNPNRSLGDDRLFFRSIYAITVFCWRLVSIVISP